MPTECITRKKCVAFPGSFGDEALDSFSLAMLAAAAPDGYREGSPS
jgi:hypothetical protein